MQIVNSSGIPVTLPIQEGTTVYFKVCGLPPTARTLQIGFAGLGASTLSLGNPSPSCFTTGGISTVAGNYTMVATVKDGAGVTLLNCSAPYLIVALTPTPTPEPALSPAPYPGTSERLELK